MQTELHACLEPVTSYCSVVRRVLQIVVPLFLLLTTVASPAASGRVVKVLPHFLDLEGRHSVSPSLYDRDAYQAELRAHPEKRSGIRFDILWRGRGQPKQKARLRVEMRGSAKGNLPTEKTLETEVTLTGISKWVALKLDGEEYKKFGEVTAWRVTLWDGDQLLGEQKSFLWQTD
ncbi:MAG TPA: hypothetical protein VFZ59_16330 [Verrucomicrobiae bacterium]|nr:hypothetical protein [Verrucomicrobiae bacterium]